MPKWLRLTTTVSWPAFACPAHAVCASASRASHGVVGQHQHCPSQGRQRKQRLYIRVQLPADPCGSVRAAQEALAGLHAPKCCTGLASSRLLGVVSQSAAVLGGNAKEAAACTPQTSSCGTNTWPGAVMSPDSSFLLGMSWSQDDRRYFTQHLALWVHHTPALLGCHRAWSTPRRFPSPRSCCQKAPKFAEGCVLPFVVFLPCLEKGFEV